MGGSSVGCTWRLLQDCKSTVPVGSMAKESKGKQQGMSVTHCILSGPRGCLGQICYGFLQHDDRTACDKSVRSSTGNSERWHLIFLLTCDWDSNMFLS